MSLGLVWASFGLVSGSSTVWLAARLSGPECVVLPPGWMRPLTREGFAAGLVLGAGIAVLAYRFAGTADLLTLVWFVVTGVPLMLIDWICHRLPTRLVGAMFIGGIVNLSCLALARDEMTSLLRALGAAAVVFGGTLAAAVAAPASLGGGDVRLLGTAALYLGWIGWAHVVRGIVLALVLAAAAGVFLTATGRLEAGDRLAFGPAIVGATLIVLVLP